MENKKPASKPGSNPFTRPATELRTNHRTGNRSDRRARILLRASAGLRITRAPNDAERQKCGGHSLAC